MEAAVSNLTSPGNKVLVLTAGKFGERWVGLAKAFGCEPDVLSAPYGETFDLAEVRKAIRPEHRVVYVQATETSTAVSHDVEAIAKLIKEVAPETLLVVDGITGLGTTHFDVDGWGIDVLIGGSQKAVMIPPGLAYLSVSEKAWAAMEKSKNPRYYFDLRKERKNAVKGESAYTPAVALVAGLGAALDYIQSIGKARIRAHEHKLLTYAHDRLREINSLRIIGSAADKGAIVSFEMKNAHAHDFATVIDRAGIAVRAGTHCAMPLLERFGVTATCRASFALYNTHDEVDALAGALVKAQEFFA